MPSPFAARAPKAETFLVLEGEAEVLIFDDAGNVTERYRLGGDADAKVWGVDLTPGVWHTLIAISERAVCFEVKPGPWDPATDKDFAAWAPAEGDGGVSDYLTSLGGLMPGL